MKEPWQIMYDKYGEDLLPQNVIDDFAQVRERIKKAIDTAPKQITLEQAFNQIKLFHEEKISKKN